MIKADLHQPDVKHQERTATRTIFRLNARVFWILLMGEAFLLVAALAWFLSYGTQPSTALTNAADISVVREALWTRLLGTTDDPLMEVQPGVSVRESNVRGFSLNGVIYYYYVEGNQNFDPFSRGAVSADQIEILLRDADGPLPVVIYTIRESEG